MHDLYPDVLPFASHRLKVDEIHTLYVEECGRQDGVAAVFLHGGPGAGCESYHRRFFDPSLYHVVLFDQRGCGRSTPHVELGNNTTQHLVQDIETIREHLEIDHWLVFGGSWGSTLALAYAEAYPNRVLGLILRGVFMCRDRELYWFYQRGASEVFPDYWEEFLKPIPETERGDLLHAYHRRLNGTNELARMSAAKAWSGWESRTASLLPNDSIVSHFGNPHTALSLACLENHYFVNHAFLEPNQLLHDAPNIAEIPGVIVQGRYDLICPMTSAWELRRAWSNSRLDIIPDAGHSASEPGIRAALVQATDQFGALFG